MSGAFIAASARMRATRSGLARNGRPKAIRSARFSRRAFTAIALRQCTRGDYAGKPLSGKDLALLQRAGSSETVRLVLHTERPAMEQTLDYVMQGNTAQMADAAFVKELKT